MEWAKIGLSTLAVYVLLFIVGSVVAVASTMLQCGKIGWGTSLYQGFFFAFFPSILFLLAIIFTVVRNPFANTLAGFGVSREHSPVYGVGYLVMIAAWPFVVWLIHSVSKTVCVSSAAEITDFKKKLMAELQTKEEEKQANAEAKPTT